MIRVPIDKFSYKEIPWHEILYCEYKERRIYIHTKEDIYQLKDGIRAFAEKVKSECLRMPHQSFLVNMQHICNIQKYEITLDNGELIPLSQKRSATFRKDYREFRSLV